MISYRPIRSLLLTLVALGFLSGALLSSLTHAKGIDAAKRPVIRITPPAPQINDKDRVAELVARRARVARSIGPKAILILFSGEPRVYTNDVDYQFRQENNLYYLTNLKQKGATLVIRKNGGAIAETLYLAKRDPQNETW